jgi:hypothetical protein
MNNANLTNLANLLNPTAKNNNAAALETNNNI